MLGYSIPALERARQLDQRRDRHRDARVSPPGDCRAVMTGAAHLPHGASTATHVAISGTQKQCPPASIPEHSPKHHQLGRACARLASRAPTDCQYPRTRLSRAARGAMRTKSRVVGRRGYTNRCGGWAWRSTCRFRSLLSTSVAWRPSGSCARDCNTRRKKQRGSDAVARPPRLTTAKVLEHQCTRRHGSIRRRGNQLHVASNACGTRSRMRDVFAGGATPSTWTSLLAATPPWMTLLAAGLVALAIVLGIGGYVARRLDQRGKRDEFSTENGRHDWRGHR